MRIFEYSPFLHILTIIKIISFAAFLIVSFPSLINAQSPLNQMSRPTEDACFSSSRLATTMMQSTITRHEQLAREDRCLRSAQYIGAMSGSFMGLAHIYWSATGVSGIHGPFWKNVLTGLPSAVIGAYVGSRTTQWMTRRIMDGNPKPAKAALKGAAYGALNGAVILTASFVPILITGYYADTIHFNMSEDMILLKLIGSSVLGGTLYGGTIGAAVGALYGPSISVYMRF